MSTQGIQAHDLIPKAIANGDLGEVIAELSSA